MTEYSAGEKKREVSVVGRCNYGMRWKGKGVKWDGMGKADPLYWSLIGRDPLLGDTCWQLSLGAGKGV